jgi:hypothetical protein
MRATSHVLQQSIEDLSEKGAFRSGEGRFCDCLLLSRHSMRSGEAVQIAKPNTKMGVHMRAFLACAIIISAAIGMGGCWWHHQAAVVTQPPPPLK